MEPIYAPRWEKKESEGAKKPFKAVVRRIEDVEASWIDICDGFSNWKICTWFVARFRSACLAGLQLATLAGWWAAGKSSCMCNRFPALGKVQARVRRVALEGVHSAAQAYSTMSWTRVAALTALVLGAIATADMMLGHLVSFRLIYVLPIWIAARLGGASAGFFTMLVVGALLTFMDSQLLPPGGNFALDFAVRWIGLGGFLLTVLHVEGALRHARQMASHDPLTGLVNRATIESMAEIAIDDCRGKSDCLHVVVIDCDRFKEINDQSGHAFGDHALKVLARRLVAGLRDCGSVGRLGGDEFVVLMQGVDRHQAAIAMEKVNQAFKRVMASLGANSSISFGIATLGADGNDFNELCRIADERMFARKRTRQAAVWVADHSFDRRAS